MSDKRIQPLIRDCAALKEKFPPEHKWAKQSMNFDGGFLKLAGANSRKSAKVRSIPARYLFLDETSAFPDTEEGNSQSQAEERTKAQPLSKILTTSTPLLTGDNILNDLEQSDYRRYQVPCPLCGVFQVLQFKQLRWPRDKDGRSVPPAAAREATYYECSECGGAVYERHKKWMLDHGRWVKRGKNIEVKSELRIRK